jgi:hypothetical protein
MSSCASSSGSVRQTHCNEQRQQCVLLLVRAASTPLLLLLFPPMMMTIKFAAPPLSCLAVLCRPDAPVAAAVVTIY